MRDSRCCSSLQPLWLEFFSLASSNTGCVFAPLQKRFVELDGGVSRVTGLLDTLAASDRLQAAAAAARASALSAGALPACPGAGSRLS